MCIAIAKPGKRKLKTDYYVNSFRHNKDGAGVAWVENNEVKLKKGIFDEKEFVKFVEDREEFPMVIHCRIATHGEVGLDNCHPFIFKSEDHPEFTWAVAHNGILPWRSTKKQSDTSCFIEDFLQPLLNQNPWFFEQPFCTKMLGSFIENRNKLVVLRHDTKKNETVFYIVNEIMGEKAHGCWFSNTSHLYPRYQAAQQQDWEWEGGCRVYKPRNVTPALPAANPTAPSSATPSHNQNENKVVASAEAVAIRTKYGIADEFGDWVNMDRKYVNVNPEYTGGNKATAVQRERWQKAQQELLALGKKPVPETPALPTSGNIVDMAKYQPKDGEKTVEVPRDPGVLPDDKPDKDEKVPDHVDKEEWELLRKWCAMWYARHRFPMKGLKTSEMVERVRDEMRELLPHAKGQRDEDLDLMLLMDGQAILEDLEHRETERKMAEAADEKVD